MCYSGFNPLHCGAVVASAAWRRGREDNHDVSIPFIAGQWSLLQRAAAPESVALEFQSPSLRGSGRFVHNVKPRDTIWSGFNPLHCGAVVASEGAGNGRRRGGPGFNPLHCGAVVASCCRRGGGAGRCRVSIPFIAGQWSLRGDPRRMAGGRGRFNPLHCGAVVASRRAAKAGAEVAEAFQSPSLRGSGRFPRTRPPDPGVAGCFNPLHCGAVVASRRMAGGRGSSGVAFQSPSLRGSGRFPTSPSSPCSRRACFNPLHCGAVVASFRVGVSVNFAPFVSIPFIAGQWSLLPRTTPSSLFGVLLRKRRLPCDHIICTRLPF